MTRFAEKIIALLLAALLIAGQLCGCGAKKEENKTVIAATTWPVFQFAKAVCEGTDLTVEQIVTGQVSCLHDYTLTTNQMRIIERADLILMSGANLEEYMADAVAGKTNVLTCSAGIELLQSDEGDDPHIWLDPDNAAKMVRNIRVSLSERYPEHAETFGKNAQAYCEKLEDLKRYGEETLEELKCRKLITFHDGFSYFANAFGLEILAALEEEDGAMASAQTLRSIIGLVRENGLPAVFTEEFGSDSAASVIREETGVKTYMLKMAMSGDDYLTAVRYNIDTVKEALG